MLAQVGVCSGVENYSRHFDGRAPGTPPHTLLDFFPDDFLLVADDLLDHAVAQAELVITGRRGKIDGLPHAVQELRP